MDKIDHLPLLSIVVPVYNTSKYLQACIDSILNQTYPKIEIILVDDGSQDSSGSICDNYADSHCQIHTIHKENGGQASARNIGIQESKGEFITFIDSDDIYGDIRTLEVCMRILCCHPDIDVVQFPLRFSSEDGTTIEPFLSYFRQHYDTQSNLTNALADWLCFSNSNITTSVCDKIFRRSCIADSRFTNVYCEDAFFLIELIEKKPHILVQTEGLYLYIQHEGSTMNSARTLKKSIETVYLYKELYQAVHKYSDIFETHFRCFQLMKWTLLDIYFNQSRKAFRKIKVTIPCIPLKYLSVSKSQRLELITLFLFGMKNSMRLKIAHIYLRLCLQKITGVFN